MFYENELFLMKGEDDERAHIKLVDFTHVLDGNGVGCTRLVCPFDQDIVET